MLRTQKHHSVVFCFPLRPLAFEYYVANERDLRVTERIPATTTQPSEGRLNIQYLLRAQNQSISSRLGLKNR